MRNSRSLARLLLIAVASGAGSTRGIEAVQGPSKARIAILDFDFAKSNRIAEREKVRTDLLTTKINTALVSSRRFDVIERQDLERVLTEGKFSRSSLADPGQAARLGKMLSADYIVLGEISIMEVRADKSAIPYLDRMKADVRGTIVLDVRVVDVRTGKIERAAKVEAAVQQTVQGVSASDPVEPNDLFYEDLQRQAAERTASKIVSSLYPVKISMYDGEVAYLNVGEGTGVRVGDLFVVQELGTEIFDPDTGDSLGRVERPIAAIEVTAVEERRSKAQTLGGSGVPAQGMICRPASRGEVEAFLARREARP